MTLQSSPSSDGAALARDPGAAAAPSRGRRVVLRLLGERPWLFLAFYAPTLLAIALDLVVRPRALSLFTLPLKGLYLACAIAGSGLWALLLWLASRLFLVRAGRARVAARAGLALLFGGVFLPFACLAYGGQALHHRVFDAYASRDGVRLGIRMRGTVIAWFLSFGGGLASMIAIGALVTALVAWLVRRAAAPTARTWPVLPVAGFAIASYCYWADFIETRAVQAAPPDACLLHGAVYAVRSAIEGAPMRGVTLRTPDPLPPLEPAAHRPNVIVILSESLRADAMCSERREGCDAPFLDEAAPDRIAMGKLSTQSSGTFTACMTLWTGLPPDADFLTAHRAAMLWELAGAVGYRTAYVGAQNLTFQDMGTYLRRAGIDVRVGAAELGDAPDMHLGAPDERAAARMLAFAREGQPGTPYFGLLHLSNTHWPYRVDPALQPFEPHDDRLGAGMTKLHNHYRNSVRLQERSMAAFVRELRALPGWDDTAVIFLSDHGEQFREHGAIYHLNNLFDEELRIPGWIVAGDRALDASQRAALRTFASMRTYGQDVHATILDLLGVLDQRPKLPFAPLLTGRSLLRSRPEEEPIAPLTTHSGVYEDDIPHYGARRGELLIVGTETRPFQCFDSRADPKQRKPASMSKCGSLLGFARERFPVVPAQRE